MAQVDEIVLNIRETEESEEKRNFLHRFNQSQTEKLAKGNFLDILNEFMVKEESSEFQSQTEKLARVPKVLRDDESIKECFEPIFVSIGPYHHENSKLQPAKDLKIKMARHFVSAYGCSAGILYDKLFHEIKQIRDFYENELTDNYNDEAFTQILFVDRCFILFFLDSIALNVDFSLKNNKMFYVWRDMLLLENQLPFQVLKLLGEGFNRWPRMIELYIDFIVNNLMPIKGRWKKCYFQPENSSHLVQLFQKGLQGSHKVKKGVKIETFTFLSTHSVTELREVGIHCKPSNQGGFNCTRFSSHWFHGVLELPPMTVGVLTRLILLNLIAYEMHLDVHDSAMQSYIWFLASLLRKPQDVKALRKARILYNYIGSDEETMQLIKEIACKLSPRSIVGHCDVQMQIGSYLDQRGKTLIASWLAEVISIYFRSPWTTMSVLAGFIALSATIIQTIVTIVTHN